MFIKDDSRVSDFWCHGTAYRIYIQFLAHVVSYGIAILAVCLCCCVEIAFAGTFQEIGERVSVPSDLNCLFFDYGQRLPAPTRFSSINSFKFGANAVFESSGGFVEVSDFPVFVSPTFGESVVNDFHCKCSNYSTGSERDGRVKGYHVNSLLLGFLLVT